jgi:ADP-ribosylglycohydrolase
MRLAEGFSNARHFDGMSVANEWVRWMELGPRDMGNATREGLSAVANGTPWYEGGMREYVRNPTSAANGSLMRNGVVAAMGDDLDSVFRISVLQSLPTHYGPLPVLCCCAQTFLIWQMLRSETLGARRSTLEHWKSEFCERFHQWVIATEDMLVRAWYSRMHNFRDAIIRFKQADFEPDSFNPFTEAYAGRSGYCLLTLQIGVWALQWSLRGDPFPLPDGLPTDVSRRAVGPTFLPMVVMIGHDADTYGATAGPMIAAAHEQVPDELTSELTLQQRIDLLGWWVYRQRD